ncbi:DUF202 domain-containing protein [Streptomyces sp. CBMA156]|uniref:DUF202 domain-containing protein n=1 Tax=Streptomyces sp. CBMA156 TaxID=1930280 RepID=UPI001661A0BD|nr:DUF202 domain-containing protein [Streptomyces sp. CBMA156]MBD0672100.1 hypothetical protein [Streptomyces sp. CBMA156]
MTPPGHTDGPADPGLQPERTTLAGRRTALSALVVAVLALRGALAHRAPAETVVGVLLLVVAALSVTAGTGTRARVRRVAMTACAAAAGLLVAVQIVRQA